HRAKAALPFSDLHMRARTRLPARWLRRQRAADRPTRRLHRLFDGADTDAARPVDETAHLDDRCAGPGRCRRPRARPAQRPRGPDAEHPGGGGDEQLKTLGGCGAHAREQSTRRAGREGEKTLTQRGPPPDPSENRPPAPFGNRTLAAGTMAAGDPAASTTA